MLSLSVKRSCFHTKAHLVFHCCLYNKIAYQLKSVILKKIPNSLSNLQGKLWQEIGRITNWILGD